MVAQLLLCNNCVLIVTIIGIAPALSLSPPIRSHGRPWSINASSDLSKSQPWSRKQLKGHRSAHAEHEADGPEAE